MLCRHKHVAKHVTEYGAIILTELQAFIGVTRCYLSHLFLCDDYVGSHIQDQVT